MSSLRVFFEMLGFGNVRTLLQTGNVVFNSRIQMSSEIEALLEIEAKKHLDLETNFFVRTRSELSSIVAQNPYPAEATRDPGHLVVQFLKDAVSASAVKSLQAAIAGPEYVRAKGMQLYAVYPAGIGRSKLTTRLIERQLGTRATGRNWNTVLKLAAMTDA
jgi:uncharacterized protein (DUF1697 family)